MKKISVIIVNYKSTKKTINFLKNIPNKYKIIIVDNSNNDDLSLKLEKKDNIFIVKSKNNGYGAAINKGRKEINTSHFFAFSPDIQGVNENFFEEFEKTINSNLKFAAIGPRFTQVTQKSHKQSNINEKFGKINAISGAALLLDTQAFDEINGFDDKIFLFFEENDLCARFQKKRYSIYQLNDIKVFHPKGVDNGVVDIKNESHLELKNFYGWHYMWSKFYHYKKNKFYFFSYIYFLPVIFRLLLRISYHWLLRDKNKRLKYSIRLNGLLNSMINNPSNKRIELNNFN